MFKRLFLFQRILIVSTLLITLAFTQTDITNGTECGTCMTTTGYYVCKNDYSDTGYSYCCPDGSTSRSCRRDFCSGDANTTIMKLYTCPYVAKQCGGSNSKLTAELGKTNTYELTSSSFKYGSICYWTIQSSDYAAGINKLNNSFITLTFSTYTNVYVYLNNGLSPKSATNSTTIGDYTTTTATYYPNTTIYLFAVAYDSNPKLSFKYSYYQINTTNTTNTTTNTTINCTSGNYSIASDGTIICYLASNDSTITLFVPKFKEPHRPQLGIMLLMLLIIVGTGSYFVLDAIENMKYYKKPNKKVVITTLTDLELKPIDQQDIDYENALVYFSTAKENKDKLKLQQEFQKKALTEFLADSKKESKMLKIFGKKDTLDDILQKQNDLNRSEGDYLKGSGFGESTKRVEEQTTLVPYNEKQTSQDTNIHDIRLPKIVSRKNSGEQNDPMAISIRNSLAIGNWNPLEDRSGEKSQRSPAVSYVRPLKASRHNKPEDDHTPGSRAFAQVLNDVLATPKVVSSGFNSKRMSQNYEQSMINIADSNQDPNENSNINSPELSQRIMRDPGSGSMTNKKASLKISSTKGTGFNSKKNSSFANHLKPTQKIEDQTNHDNKKDLDASGQLLLK